MDRFLRSDAVGDTAGAAPRLGAFRRFLMLSVTVELWELLPFWAGRPLYGLHVGIALAASVACIAGLTHRWARPASVALLALMAADHASAFPLNANHQYLGMIVLGSLCLLDLDDDAERQLLLLSLRMLPVIGLLWAGLQKVLWGYYFGGEFLAYAISYNEGFAALFGWTLPAEETARLQALEFGAGAGPYRVASPLFVAISNATWIGELALPLLLLSRRARALGIVAVILYIAAIEAGARELFFGLLMVNLVLLWGRRDLNSPALPASVIVLLYVLAMSWGLLPRWYFS
jgi:hypothetical protein